MVSTFWGPRGGSQLGRPPASQKRGQAGIQVSTTGFHLSVLASHTWQECFATSLPSEISTLLLFHSPFGEGSNTGLSRSCDRIMGKQFGGADFCLVALIPPRSAKNPQ
jgi:hypothetical protein